MNPNGFLVFGVFEEGLDLLESRGFRGIFWEFPPIFVEKRVGTGMRDWEQGKQQIRLGEVPVEKIRLDLKSRDDIPAVLRGLQALYCDPRTRKQRFELLESALGSDRDLSNGRPGMPMWSMVVLAVLKEGLNCDWDRLHELVNQHGAVREMLGDSRFGGHQYDRQTLIDNVSLLTPELLRAVGELVVSIGHEVVQRKAGGGLSARCDSCVVEPDVRFPTDMGLLWDATRVAVRICSKLAEAQGLAGWRQRRHLVRQLRRRYQRVCTSRRWKGNPQGVKAYLSSCRQLRQRVAATMDQLAGSPVDLSERHRLVSLGTRLEDQIERRVLEGETIPASEKIFSVFEEHTRWISKGKAGRPVELGVPLTVIEDQHQFMLDYRIMWEGGDVEAAVPLVESCKQRYPELTVCSFDRGFHSPVNRSRLEQMLEVAALPAKGRLSSMAKAREREARFAAARQQHPAVESAIHHLESHGLDRVRTHARQGFARTVALAVLSTNLHRLGTLLLARDRKRERRRSRALLRQAA